jgi:opacity protein-like surface antigen
MIFVARHGMFVGQETPMNGHEQKADCSFIAQKVNPSYLPATRRFPQRSDKQRKNRMKKIAFTALAAMGAIALPAAAQAQDAKPEVTIGAQVGLHDLGVEVDSAAIDDAIDDSGEIYGVFAAVDFPIGETLFAGIEGNANLGSGPIDAEYGVSGRFGLKTQGGSKIYARGGYQWVDIDVGGLVDVPGFDEDSFTGDTTVGDYLVGVGVEFPISSVVLRANVDTIAFDSLRGTVGVGFKF